MRRRKARPKAARRILYILPILIVVVIGSFFYIWQRWEGYKEEINQHITQGSETVIEVLDEPPAPEEPLNILIVGKDARPELQDGGPGHADAIMLLRLDPRLMKGYLISVLRDTRVEIPGYGAHKINAALAWGGEELLIQVVQDFLGLPIHHYVTVDFEGFKKLVDVLGGVDVVVNQPLIDELSGANFPVGEHHLDGEQALAFVRSRSYITADKERVYQQQYFLRQLVDQHLTVANLAKIPEFFELLKEYIRTDLDIDTILRYSLPIRQSDPRENLIMATIPTTPKFDEENQIWYEIPRKDEIEVMIQNILEGKTPVKYGAEYDDLGTTPEVMEVNKEYNVKVKVTNTGYETWRNYGIITNLSYHWYEYETGKVVMYHDGKRAFLPVEDLKPGESVTYELTVVAPSAPGSYLLQYDLVLEGVVWFSRAGNPTLDRVIEVKEQT
ncbi:MAG: putative transcriptional regulator YvhJ [Actinobacteria bacterium]|nr:putative transcriptional regulator YvhJ [Actinomycetota bacterium]